MQNQSYSQYQAAIRPKVIYGILPASYNAKISLEPAAAHTRLVWKFFKSTQNQYWVF